MSDSSIGGRPLWSPLHQHEISCHILSAVLGPLEYAGFILLFCLSKGIQVKWAHHSQQIWVWIIILLELKKPITDISTTWYFDPSASAGCAILYRVPSMNTQHISLKKLRYLGLFPLYVSIGVQSR